MTLMVRRRCFVKGVVAAGFATALPYAGANAQENRHHLVEIRKFKFVPDTLSVKSGDTITWVNHDIVPHTATASDKSWDTGKIKKGERGQVTVGDGFADAYFCRFHPNMKASLKVDG